jgi:hypothetical protein
MTSPFPGGDDLDNVEPGRTLAGSLGEAQRQAMRTPHRTTETCQQGMGPRHLAAMS